MSHSLEVGVSHGDRRQKGTSQMINREKFCFGSVNVDMSILAPVNNSLQGLNELISFNIETDVNGCFISIDTKLRTDISRKVTDEN